MRAEQLFCQEKLHSRADKDFNGKLEIGESFVDETVQMLAAVLL